MPQGHWSFLHEWVIYDYLLARSEEKTLRLKQIFSEGRLLGKAKWRKVESMWPITGTTFPDIQGIKIKGDLSFRPAEVKFTTSLFNYHNEAKYSDKFTQFINQRGFILVASHDYLPTKNLIELYPNIEVFEIEIDDFITFCRENFSRLLNRQIKAHSISRVWLMYQGPNFNEGIERINAARDSLIWCPTENLTGFDLAPGDRLLFYKTSGLDRIKLQNKFLNEGMIDDRWILREIYVAEVTSKIFSRYEYHQYKKHPTSKQLWKNDPLEGIHWRWNRVFEFKKIKSISVDKQMNQIYLQPQGQRFVSKAWEAFCFGKSREISLKDYRDLLETLA
jgi:hypothetical protein